MTNKDLKRAYDSVNPTPAEKERMLRAILERAEVRPEPAERGEVIQYKRQSAGRRKGSPLPVLAAGLALVVALGIILIRFRTQGDPVAVEPTTVPVQTVPQEVPTLPEPETVPPEVAESAYGEILDRYRRALAENWTAEQCSSQNISSRTPIANEYDGLYYAIADLDGNGSRELVVTQSNWADTPTEFLDIYTVKNGEAILIASDREFLRPQLFEGGVIMHTDPGMGNSQARNYAGYLRLRGESFAMETASYQTEDGQWYEWSGKNQTAEKITEERAGEIAGTYRRAELSFRSLLEQPEADFRTGETDYDHILLKYKTALEEGWTAEQCDAADISRDILDQIGLGWCLVDVDFNGTQELIIADEYHVFDLYTMLPDDRGPGHLICSTGPEMWTLFDNGMLQMMGLYSGASAWRWYTLEGVDLVQQDMVFYEYDGYSCGKDDHSLVPISKEEAGALINRYRAAKLERNFFTAAQEKAVQDREVYRPVLELYGRALQEGWDPGQCAEGGISLMIGYRGQLFDSFGAAFLDLDGNGTEELLITDGDYVFDLYTIIDDEEYGPVRLLSGTERNTYRLMEGNVIFNQGSGSAAVQYYTYYTLEGRELKLIEGYVYNGEETGENPWFYYDGETIGDRCEDTSPADIVSSGYTPVSIPFTPYEN